MHSIPGQITCMHAHTPLTHPLFLFFKLICNSNGRQRKSTLPTKSPLIPRNSPTHTKLSHTHTLSLSLTPKAANIHAQAPKSCRKRQQQKSTTTLTRNISLSGGDRYQSIPCRARERRGGCSQVARMRRYCSARVLFLFFVCVDPMTKLCKVPGPPILLCQKKSRQ